MVMQANTTTVAHKELFWYSFKMQRLFLVGAVSGPLSEARCGSALLNLVPLTKSR